MRYIYDIADWPNFRWDEAELAATLAAVRHRQGRLLGRMEALGFASRNEAFLRTLTDDVVKSSEIEGENLDRDQVRSSIARRLGLDIGALAPADRHVDGVVEMSLDATRNFDEPLDADRLFGWHAALFPSGRSGMSKIAVGRWRDDDKGPMQVISGAVGRQRVHFQAPQAERLDAEMARFLTWFNGSPDSDPVIRAAVAHLWFVTLHPFEDGNGRIARAIADMALARSENSRQRFYSMSSQIRLERQAYYDRLESTQKGDLDIMPWLTWFLACLDRAIGGAEETLDKVFAKARFWDKHAGSPLNPRQRDIVNRLLDGFEGKMTSSKYAKLGKCSQDTALRDINELIGLGILQKNDGGGRSTSYALETT